jgi:hypothetical protein
MWQPCAWACSCSRSLRLVLLSLIIPLLVLQVLVSLKLERSFEYPYNTQPHTITQPHTHTQPQQQLYPRWADPNGIPLQPLLNFSIGAAQGHLQATTTQWPKQRARFPEILYCVDPTGVRVSRTLRDRSWKRMVPYRLEPTEGIFQLAWSMLMTTDTNMNANTTSHDNSIETTTTTTQNDNGRWQVLKRAISSGGFPFLVIYSDYKSCNHFNWNNNLSIPLFTTCAQTHCQYAFPIPTYKTIRDSQASSSDWQAVFDSYATNYTHESKIRKLVWRGSLSGPNNDLQSPRWRLGKLVTEQDATGLFDVGLVSIPSRHDHLQLNLTLVGGLAKPIHPMTAFQKYVAVLDIDGNSWSSRFGTLLCYNSVVLKVDPEYVDYFHFKDLKPWKHYVPVKHNLSDLVENTAFVTDPANDEAVREIVAHANDWCKRRMVRTAIAEDVLDIWDAYVRLLDQADAGWMEEWKRAKTTHNFTDLLRMVQITQILDKKPLSQKTQSWLKG